MRQCVPVGPEIRLYYEFLQKIFRHGAFRNCMESRKNSGMCVASNSVDSELTRTERKTKMKPTENETLLLDVKEIREDQIHTKM